MDDRSTQESVTGFAGRKKNGSARGVVQTHHAGPSPTGIVGADPASNARITKLPYERLFNPRSSCLGFDWFGLIPNLSHSRFQNDATRGQRG